MSSPIFVYHKEKVQIKRHLFSEHTQFYSKYFRLKASLTQWTWVWANSGSQWRTGRPGVLQPMGLQSRTRLSDRKATTNSNSDPEAKLETPQDSGDWLSTPCVTCSWEDRGSSPHWRGGLYLRSPQTSLTPGLVTAPQHWVMDGREGRVAPLTAAEAGAGDALVLHALGGDAAQRARLQAPVPGHLVKAGGLPRASRPPGVSTVTAPCPWPHGPVRAAP